MWEAVENYFTARASHEDEGPQQPLESPSGRRARVRSALVVSGLARSTFQISAGLGDRLRAAPYRSPAAVLEPGGGVLALGRRQPHRQSLAGCAGVVPIFRRSPLVCATSKLKGQLQT